VAHTPSPLKLGDVVSRQQMSHADHDHEPEKYSPDNPRRRGGFRGGIRPPTPGMFQHNGHEHPTDPQTTLIQHGGHSHTLADAEQHGGLIFGTMVLTMMLAQLALVTWKKFSPHTLDQATLLALWLFPVGYCIYHGVWEYLRMITIWCIFSVVCGVVMRKALKKPIERTTPRMVYKFFYMLYRLSYGSALAGYVIMMMHFLGFGEFLPWWLLPTPSVALLCGFYGLYYGVLGRDLANVCSQGMSVSLGYVGKKGEMPLREVPRNTCAICDGELIRSFRPTAEGRTAEPEEKVIKLNCSHQFHQDCLRGWTMIGKRQTCACCNEKVSVAGAVSKLPWVSLADAVTCSLACRLSRC
jgi:RING finger protein 121